MQSKSLSSCNIINKYLTPLLSKKATISPFKTKRQIQKNSSAFLKKEVNFDADTLC
jgi:hypothetical protein